MNTKKEKTKKKITNIKKKNDEHKDYLKRNRGDKNI